MSLRLGVQRDAAYSLCSPTFHEFEFEVKIYFFFKFDTWSDFWIPEEEIFFFFCTQLNYMLEFFDRRRTIIFLLLQWFMGQDGPGLNHTVEFMDRKRRNSLLLYLENLCPPRHEPFHRQKKKKYLLPFSVLFRCFKQKEGLHGLCLYLHTNLPTNLPTSSESPQPPSYTSLVSKNTPNVYIWSS